MLLLARRKEVRDEGGMPGALLLAFLTVACSERLCHKDTEFRPTGEPAESVATLAVRKRSS